LKGSIKPPYLILSVVVFPDISWRLALRLSVERMIFNILFHWFWIAGLLILVGFATDYLF
jgi:putative colanic acid biosynthesis UDP-glucose lipid carrier transferase